MARKQPNKRGPGRYTKDNSNLVDFPIKQQQRRRTTPIKILPRNVAQENYIYQLANPDNSMIFAVGPAGTGKTLIATQWAINGLITGEYKKIVLTRPNISVDDADIGHLPGDIMEKMDPWIKPITSEFLEHFSKEDVVGMFEQEIVEVVPVAFMRGRTFKNAIILVDEAQNTTPASLMAILTRIGEGSKIIITGDIDQSDRPRSNNGLKDFLIRLGVNPIKGVEAIQFTRRDVERHPIIGDILRLYGEDPEL